MAFSSFFCKSSYSIFSGITVFKNHRLDDLTRPNTPKLKESVFNDFKQSYDTDRYTDRQIQIYLHIGSYQVSLKKHIFLSFY